MNKKFFALFFFVGGLGAAAHGEVRGGELGKGPDNDIGLMIVDRTGDHSDIDVRSPDEKTAPSEMISRANDLFDTFEEDVVTPKAPTEVRHSVFEVKKPLLKTASQPASKSIAENNVKEDR